MDRSIEEEKSARIIQNAFRNYLRKKKISEHGDHHTCKNRDENKKISKSIKSELKTTLDLLNNYKLRRKKHFSENQIKDSIREVEQIISNIKTYQTCWFSPGNETDNQEKVIYEEDITTKAIKRHEEFLNTGKKNQWWHSYN